MADRMAHWADCGWQIETETDLDRYTFSVAGSVGLLLSDLWAWYDGTSTDRIEAIGFGRGLQSVNILRNHGEDLTRSVDFYPDGWTNDDMQVYARRQIQYADAYTASLPPDSPAFEFCQIILALAHATLDTMQHGAEKLTRSQVLALVQQVTQVS
jgi:farnesyl-diphosphate farnesyltransferase